MEERDDNQLQEEEQLQASPLRKRVTAALQYHSMSMAEKAKYAAYAGGISAGVLELFGAGGPGLGLAALIGFGAGYWSEELQRGLIKKLPRPLETVSSRQNKLSWWLAGDEPECATMEQTDSVEAPARPARLAQEAQEERRLSPDRMVDLAADLQLDIDDIAGKAIFVCGIRRSGKTTLGVRTAEELGKFNIPMFIPDLKGDWLSCVKTLPNAIILGRGQATEKNAGAHGYAICDEGLQIILDVTSYDDMNEVAKVIANMINGIFYWERKHPDSRKLCAIFLDEAQSYLPQDVKDSIISEPEDRDAMLNAYMRVIAIGGSLGLFPIILTQRIAQTNKKIIGQPELLFLFKQTMDNDLNRYKDFTNISVERVRALQQGHGVFVDYEGQSSVHKFHKRSSSDAMSRTPRYNPVSNGISGKRFRVESDDFELKNANTPAEMVTETPAETNRETPEMAPETEAIKILREIGKRIKEGEDIVKIRKSLGVNSGRAVQEVNAALAFLQEHMNEEE